LECEEPERIRIRSASGRRRTKTPRGRERRLGCGDERYEPRALDVDVRDDAESAPPWEREHEERQRKEKRAAARVEEREIKPTISVSPVLNSPRLLRPNPYIPETIAHLLPYSLDAIKMVCIHFTVFIENIAHARYRSGAKLARHYITAGAPSANTRWWRSRRRRTET
jgi:hypothetical protein